MNDTNTSAAAPKPQIGHVTLPELFVCLKAGLADFRAAPQFGLFFSAVYVVGGALMLWIGAGHVTWTLATSLGFPLAAPFAAVGLYEVSRRLGDGLMNTNIRNLRARRRDVEESNAATR